ncbi:hypothetical protein Plhal304r1_c003g0009981 [Plasmopara halstedii]
MFPSCRGRILVNWWLWSKWVSNVMDSFKFHLFRSLGSSFSYKRSGSIFYSNQRYYIILLNINSKSLDKA